MRKTTKLTKEIKNLNQWRDPIFMGREIQCC